MWTRRALWVASLCVVWRSAGLHLLAQTNALAQPKGEVILTVSGKISAKNHGQSAEFDMAMLDKLRHRRTETLTPWNKEKSTFDGPLLSEILDAVGCTGKDLKVIALNDYTGAIPVEDARKWPVILATHRNGTPLTVRQKGPLLVIYPFDEYPQLSSEAYYFRSVWHVRHIEIK